MNDLEEPQIGTEERHPADTLNDGSPRKFFLFVPAIFVHSGIAAWIVPFVCRVLLLDVLDVPRLFLRSYVALAILYYLLSLVAGLAWSKVLDRLLLNTSRFVFVVPVLYFFVQLFEFSTGRKRAFDDNVTVPMALLVSLEPLLCSVGYAVGAWIRRSAVEVEVALDTPQIGLKQTSGEAWSKVVKAWRAGRSIDYPVQEEETADSSLRSE